MKEGKKLVANNKRAYHDYFIDEKFECGIELFGTEVKSIRAGKCSIKESFVRIEKGEVFVFGMHVNPYEKGNEEACSYCAYKKVCGFEPAMPGCSKNRLEELDKEEVLRRMDAP